MYCIHNFPFKSSNKYKKKLIGNLYVVTNEFYKRVTLKYSQKQYTFMITKITNQFNRLKSVKRRQINYKLTIKTST